MSFGSSFLAASLAATQAANAGFQSAGNDARTRNKRGPGPKKIRRRKRRAARRTSGLGAAGAAIGGR